MTSLAAAIKQADGVEPLRMRPKEAMAKLRCGRESLYELINNKEIDSYKDGGARWIITRSVHAHLEREVAKEKRRQRTLKQGAASAQS